MKRAILLILIVICVPQLALAQGDWDDCPHGKSCTYPGVCGRYVDANIDGICDLGQSEPTDAVTIPDGETPVSNQIQADNSQPKEEADITGCSGKTRSKLEHLMTIPAMIIAYLVTSMLSRMGRMKRSFHRKLWNVLLLFSFLGSASLGFILLLQIDFDADISMPFNLPYWHVEFSIIMGTIAVFHLIKHWKYYAKMLKQDM